MKYLKQLALAAGLTFAISFSGSAHASSAKDTHKTSITIPETAQVGSSRLKAGDYKLQWEGNGPDVNVAFVQNGRTVATVPAKLVDKKDVPADAVVFKAGDGNTRTINEIDLAKQKQALIIGSSTSSGM